MKRPEDASVIGNPAGSWFCQIVPGAEPAADGISA